MKEIWKDILEIKWIDYFWLYQVSNLWNIKSLSKYRKTPRGWEFYTKEKLLKIWHYQNWYCCITLCKNSKLKSYSIHSLVMQTFVCPYPDWMEINHKDWDKDNNTLENLEYVTKTENAKHSYHTLWNKHINKRHFLNRPLN